MIDVVVTAESSRYDASDERWLDQVRDLHADLRTEVPGFRIESVVVPGKKGVVDSVILALGSAGAFSSAVACFKAWLARDKSRRITLTWTQDGREEQIAFEGDAVDAESMRQLSEAIGRRLGGAEWQTGTGPS
jgi:Effector Associated Constant Component 1